MIPHPDTLYFRRPAQHAQTTTLEEQIGSIVHHYNAQTNRHILEDPEFRQYDLPSQIEWLVNTFTQRVCGLSSTNAYSVRPEFLIFSSPAHGNGRASNQRCIVAVPAPQLDAQWLHVPNPSSQSGWQRQGWTLGGPDGRHSNFPGPALLPQRDGHWTPAGEAFKAGLWSAHHSQPCVIDAVGPNHPNLHMYNTDAFSAPGPRAFVAGGACRVHWELADPLAYLRPLPHTTRWYLTFDIAVLDNEEDEERIETRYFVIDFSKDLMEVQRSHERFATSSGRSILNEMGSGEDMGSRKRARLAACWPETRQTEQW